MSSHLASVMIASGLLLSTFYVLWDKVAVDPWSDIGDAPSQQCSLAYGHRGLVRMRPVIVRIYLPGGVKSRNQEISMN